MTELLKILGTYEIFTNFIPGCIFFILAPAQFQSNILNNYMSSEQNMIFIAFLCYFLGTIINRIGSLVLEPIAKGRLVHYVAYKKYLEAEKIEQQNESDKLHCLVRVNNLFRAYMAMTLCLIGTNIYYSSISVSSEANGGSIFCILIAIVFCDNWINWLLCLIFALSYRKQTSYIKGNVESLLENTNDLSNKKY